MPTYVYRREDGSTFELVQRITDEPLRVDPETGQAVQRVITGAGLVFKGDGFYLTDYVRKSGNGAPPTEQSDRDEAPAAAKPAATEEA